MNMSRLEVAAAAWFLYSTGADHQRDCERAAVWPQGALDPRGPQLLITDGRSVPRGDN